MSKPNYREIFGEFAYCRVLMGDKIGWMIISNGYKYILSRRKSGREICSSSIENWNSQLKFIGNGIELFGNIDKVYVADKLLIDFETQPDEKDLAWERPAPPSYEETVYEGVDKNSYLRYYTY